MTYQQAVTYLYSQLPMFSRMGSAAFKKDLTNTRILCERLGNPHKRFKSIHVGGTNGKGSVSHMLAAIFQTAGYNTGLYTSPHLYDFRERIKINGLLAEEEFVVRFVERVQPWVSEISPSFFELTVAMAFEYFAEHQVDVAIVEVGLGGRLDSTNIISPELSVITNIGWDHMNLLGDSLEQIAFEKAGIIKKNTPVVVGEYLPETKPVFEKAAAQNNAPLVFASENCQLQSYHLTTTELQAAYQMKDGSSVEIITDLPGIYQTKNISTVLAAMDVLQEYGISRATVQSALRRVQTLTGLQGRWEVLRTAPTVVLEVAHNKEGMDQMLQHIANIEPDRLHIVIGMVKDKDAEAILGLLPTDAAYYFTQAAIPRALEGATLQSKAAQFGLNGHVFDNVNTALAHALDGAAATDLIVVCGSIFLVAEVDRNLVRKQP